MEFEFRNENDLFRDFYKKGTFDEMNEFKQFKNKFEDDFFQDEKPGYTYKKVYKETYEGGDNEFDKKFGYDKGFDHDKGFKDRHFEEFNKGTVRDYGMGRKPGYNSGNNDEVFEKTTVENYSKEESTETITENGKTRVIKKTKIRYPDGRVREIEKEEVDDGYGGKRVNLLKDREYQ